MKPNQSCFVRDKVSVVYGIVELKRRRMRWQQTAGVAMAVVLGRVLSFVLPSGLNVPPAGLRRALCESSSLGKFLHFVRTDRHP